MKKILILTLTLVLLSLVVFAQANKSLTKKQENVQGRNDQIVSRLFMLSNVYGRTNKEETKENIGKKIDQDVNYWYTINKTTVDQHKQEESFKNKKEVGDIFSKEAIEKNKKELSDEIKAGKIPAIMLENMSEDAAKHLKQRMLFENTLKTSKANRAKQKEEQAAKKAGKKKGLLKKIFKR